MEAGIVSLVVPKSGLTVALLEGSLALSDVSQTALSADLQPTTTKPNGVQHVYYDIEIEAKKNRSPLNPNAGPTWRPSKMPMRTLTKRPKRSRPPRPHKVESRSVLRNRVYPRSQLPPANDVDARCVSDLRTYIDKLKNNFVCDSLECPTLRLRRERHNVKHHPARAPRQPNSHDCENLHRKSTGSLSSPTLSRISLRTHSCRSKRLTSSPTKIFLDKSRKHSCLTRTQHSSPIPPCLTRHRSSSTKNTREERGCDSTELFSTPSYSCPNRPSTPCPDMRMSSQSRSCLKKRSPAQSSSPSPSFKDNHSVQTKITFSDLGNLIIRIDPKCQFGAKKSISHEFEPNFTPLTNKENDSNPISFCDDNDLIPLNCKETQDVLPLRIDSRISYEENLLVEVKIWIDKVPFYPNPSTLSIMLKDNAVNELVSRLNDLYNEVQSERYDQMVKFEIYNCLDSLRVWYAGDKREQATFKEGLCGELFKKIKKLNSKWPDYVRCRARLCSINPSLRMKSHDKLFVSRSTKSNHSIRCTMSSDYVCDKLQVNGQKKSKIKTSSCKKTLSKELRHEIDTWITRSKLISHDTLDFLSRKEIMRILLNRLMPLMNKPRTTASKIKLKSEICQALEDMPICLNCTGNRKLQLIRFADELTNKLLDIQEKLSFCGGGRKCSIVHMASLQRINYKKDKSNKLFLSYLKEDLGFEVNSCLEKTKIEHQKEIAAIIVDILCDNHESLRLGDKCEAIEEIVCVLNGAGELSSVQISDIVETILKRTKEILTTTYIINVLPNQPNSGNTVCLLKPCLSKALSVYESEINSGPHFSPPLTSTPKKKSKDIKISYEEQAYTNKVAALIKAWMETLPEKLRAEEDKKFKQIIINDLAFDITEEAKFQQFAPDPETDKETFWEFFITRWLWRFDVYEDLNSSEPQGRIKDLVNRLKEIPIPKMTKPHHGNRQAIENLKHVVNSSNPRLINFVPKATDILKDEISIWINEQPSELYIENNKSVQNSLVHELAEKLRPHLANKHPKNKIFSAVAKWLDKIIKPEKKMHVDGLTDILTDRIMKVPQDATLAALAVKKAKQREEVPRDPSSQVLKFSINGRESARVNANSIDPDKTMEMLILEYIQHNNDVNDVVAQGAFTELLKTELHKVNLLSRNETPDDSFSPNLNKELQYVKDISDWLKNIPIDGSYNTEGNKTRIEFVNNFAKTITEIEENRMRNPQAIDYNMQLSSVIRQYIEQLPLLPGQEGNLNLMVDQLLTKIVAGQINPLFSGSRIPNRNLANFIDEYIVINGREVIDDELKLEVWSARVLKEIKTMLRDDPNLNESQVYSKLDKLSLPGYKCLKRFNLELDYAREVSNFLKNLPLLASTENVRVIMITDLVEKITERDERLNANPNDVEAYRDLEDYIAIWISQFPLDPQKPIVAPIVQKQLMNRIERVDTEKYHQSISEQQTDKAPKKIFRSKQKCCGFATKIKDPGRMIIEAVENWSNQLPIEGNEYDVQVTRNYIANKLFQKIGDLNSDPRSQFNDHRYKDMLAYEIEVQLDDLPQNLSLKNKKEILKTALLNKLMDARAIMTENAAGENYKHKLENAIESSLPHPIKAQSNDPGFQVYKKLLATMFILENFDHGNDAVKLNYKKNMQKEIDKYFQNAQRRNAIPLDRDQIYNILYSSLYRVPLPCEKTLIDEVEEVKTWCEVNSWFEDLPLAPAAGVGKLLEWDQILRTLAKRLHEIEKKESDPEGNIKIHREITKWLTKLPLQEGQQNNIDTLANTLQTRLKLTKEDRKCVLARDKRDKGQLKSKLKGILGTSQIAGPSSGGKMWVSPPSSPTRTQIHQDPSISHKTPANLIIKTVEDWCNKLPITSNEPEEAITVKMIKERLATSIITEISEIHDSPEIFNSDKVYDYVLGSKIERIMATLPPITDPGLKQREEERKIELINSIRSIKPLIKDERDRYEYKKELNDTVNNFVEEVRVTSAEKEVLYKNLKEEIINNFVEFNYNRDDEEGKHFYKTKVYEAVSKYLKKVEDNNDKDNIDKVDSLMKANQLISEMSKVSVPTDSAVRKEVLEIRMKNEVDDFFNEFFSPQANEPKKNTVKSLLVTRLNEIENTGLASNTEKEMKGEITKCLRKLGSEVSPEKVDGFIHKLQKTAADRKAFPYRNPNHPKKIVTRSEAPTSQELQRTNPNYCPGRNVAAPTNFQKSPLNNSRDDVLPWNNTSSSGYGTQSLQQQVPVQIHGSCKFPGQPAVQDGGRVLVSQPGAAIPGRSAIKSQIDIYPQPGMGGVYIEASPYVTRYNELPNYSDREMTRSRENPVMVDPNEVYVQAPLMLPSTASEQPDGSYNQKSQPGMTSRVRSVQKAERTGVQDPSSALPHGQPRIQTGVQPGLQPRILPWEQFRLDQPEMQPERVYSPCLPPRIPSPMGTGESVIPERRAADLQIIPFDNRFNFDQLSAPTQCFPPRYYRPLVPGECALSSYPDACRRGVRGFDNSLNFSGFMREPNLGSSSFRQMEQRQINSENQSFRQPAIPVQESRFASPVRQEPPFHPAEDRIQPAPVQVQASIHVPPPPPGNQGTRAQRPTRVYGTLGPQINRPPLQNLDSIEPYPFTPGRIGTSQNQAQIPVAQSRTTRGLLPIPVVQYMPRNQEPSQRPITASVPSSSVPVQKPSSATIRQDAGTQGSQIASTGTGPTPNAHMTFGDPPLLPQPERKPAKTKRYKTKRSYEDEEYDSDECLCERILDRISRKLRKRSRKPSYWYCDNCDDYVGTVCIPSSYNYNPW